MLKSPKICGLVHISSNPGEFFQSPRPPLNLLTKHGLKCCSDKNSIRIHVNFPKLIFWPIHCKISSLGKCKYCLFTVFLAIPGTDTLLIVGVIFLTT